MKRLALYLSWYLWLVGMVILIAVLLTRQLDWYVLVPPLVAIITSTLVAGLIVAYIRLISELYVNPIKKLETADIPEDTHD